MSSNLFLVIGVLCVAITVAGGVWWWLSARNGLFSDTDIVSMQFPNGTIRAEIAASFLKHSAGLSARPSLGTDTGMLFVFSKPQPLTFWMKGMKFALDFVWIRDGMVVDISRNVQPPQSVLDFDITRPSQDADMVLEVNAGTIEGLEIKIGDKVSIVISD